MSDPTPPKTPPTPEEIAAAREVLRAHLDSRPSSACCATAEPDEEEDDPYMTAAQRDILRAQVLAMSFADTRLAVAQGATAILTSVYGTELGAALTRAVRGVLGSVGDLFDGEVGSTLTKAIMDAVLRPEAVTAAPSRTWSQIRVNGVTIGFALMTADVTPDEVIAEIRGDASLMAKVTGEVVGIDTSVPGEVNITTKPHEQPPASPSETT